MEEAPMERSVAQGATKLTYDDYLLIPDDGRRHELIDGEHFVSPAPHPDHQEVLIRLVFELQTYRRTTGAGRLLIAPTDVVFSGIDVAQPDLLYICEDGSAEVGTNVAGAPDLVVEILSPSNRRYDEVTKRNLYERAGVGEYWLVDPEAETVKVLRREGARFGRPQLLSARDGDVLSSPLLPGLAISLAALFER
jgi:Uma2 family endonuclease